MSDDSYIVGVPLSAHFGPFCIDPADGERAYGLIADGLRDDCHIFVDFEGITTLTASFLTPAIGRLYGEFPAKQIDEHVECLGLDATDRDIVQGVCDTAKRFYAMTPEQQSQLIEAQARLLNE